MASNQKQVRGQETTRRKGGKIVIRVLIVLFILAMILYCIKLNFEIKVLEQVCAGNDDTYKALYEEYIKTYNEKVYYENAYDELYEYIYSED